MWDITTMWYDCYCACSEKFLFPELKSALEDELKAFHVFFFYKRDGGSRLIELILLVYQAYLKIVIYHFCERALRMNKIPFHRSIYGSEVYRRF